MLHQASGSDLIDVTASGTWVYSDTIATNGTGSSAGTGVVALGGGGLGTTQTSGGQTVSMTDSSTETITTSGTYHQQDAYTSYEAGVVANGSLSLSSVLYQSSGSSSYSEHDASMLSYSGSGTVVETSTGTSTNAGTYGGATASGQAVSGSNGTLAYGYSGNSSYTYDAAGSTSYSDFASGIYANGCYSLGSVVHTETGNDSATLAQGYVESSQQTFVGTRSDNSNGSLADVSGFGQDTTQTQQTTGTFTDASTETFSATTAGQQSYSLYEAGSYGSMGYNLSSVLYRETSSGSYSLTDLSRETHTGNGVVTTSSQATTTDGTHTGTAATSDAATFSYTLTAIATLTAAGSYSSGDYLAGQFANGSYSLSSFTHDEQSNDSITFSSAVTYAESTSGTKNNNTQGISTTGVNGNFAYTGSGSYSVFRGESSQGCHSLHEEGTYANGSLSLSCFVLNAVGSVTSGYTASGGMTEGDGGAYSAASNFTAAGVVSAVTSLYEAGTYANGSWNLASFLLQESATSSATRTDTTSASATGQTSTGTTTASSNETYSLYARGTYGNGSFSFASYNLSDQRSASKAWAETGSNATYASYSRSDQDESSYSYAETGTGATAAQSDTSSEMTARAFTGTGLTSSATGTKTYSSSDTVDIADGGIAEIDPDAAPPEDNEAIDALADGELSPEATLCSDCSCGTRELDDTACSGCQCEDGAMEAIPLDPTAMTDDHSRTSGTNSGLTADADKDTTSAGAINGSMGAAAGAIVGGAVLGAAGNVSASAPQPGGSIDTPPDSISVGSSPADSEPVLDEADSVEKPCDCCCDDDEIECAPNPEDAPPKNPARVRVEIRIAAFLEKDGTIAKTDGAEQDLDKEVKEGKLKAARSAKEFYKIIEDAYWEFRRQGGKDEDFKISVLVRDGHAAAKLGGREGFDKLSPGERKQLREWMAEGAIVYDAGCNGFKYTQYYDYHLDLALLAGVKGGVYAALPGCGEGSYNCLVADGQHHFPYKVNITKNDNVVSIKKKLGDAQVGHHDGLLTTLQPGSNRFSASRIRVVRIVYDPDFDIEYEVEVDPDNPNPKPARK